MPLLGGESPPSAREILTPPWTAKDLSRRRVHHQWPSPSVPSRLLLQAQRAVSVRVHTRKHSPVTANAEAVGEEKENATEAK